MVSKAVSYNPNLHKAKWTQNCDNNFNKSGTEIKAKLLERRQKAGKKLQQLREKCSAVLPMLVTEDFCQKYHVKSGIPDCYVFSHYSQRCIVIEVMANFDVAESDNFETYKFRTNDCFEEILKKLTRDEGKPNKTLTTTRNWDVGLKMAMKIELFDQTITESRKFYLLRRENAVMQHMWCEYLMKDCDIGEMTGIPIVFDYRVVENSKFFLKTTELNEQINKYGHLVELKPSGDSEYVSCLSYLTMELLGPRLSYLIDISHKAYGRIFDVFTALKIFDQILCRILQLHRLGVVHNSICPNTIYFGQGACDNVVYLSGFKSAHIVSKNKFEQQQPFAISSSVVKSSRFASINIMKHTNVHPIDDIESAFYTLLAMICPTLPWDVYDENSQDTDESNENNNNKSRSKAGKQCNNNYKFKAVQNVKSTLELKKEFWKSDEMLKLTLARAAQLWLQAGMVSRMDIDIVVNIYRQICEIHKMGAFEDDPSLYCQQLSYPKSRENGIFIELRKSTLVCFKFASLKNPFNMDGFPEQNKKYTENDDDNRARAFDLSIWCFRSVHINSRPS